MYTFGHMSSRNNDHCNNITRNTVVLLEVHLFSEIPNVMFLRYAGELRFTNIVAI